MNGPSLPELIVELQDLYRRMAALMQAAMPFVQSKPASDPFGGVADRTTPSTTLLSGVVRFVVPYFGFYGVTPFGGGAAVPCRLARDTSSFPFAGRPAGGPQPFDRVWFTTSPMSPYGTILAIDPGHIHELDPFLHDYMSQAAPAAPAADRLLMAHVTAKHGLADYSNGGLLDATGLERGWSFPTGTAMLLDPFMAMLRADENCGFWAFFYDQLARMHGHNLQIRSALYESEYLDDGGELLGVEGYSPYAWEAYGKFTKGEAPGKTFGVEDVQLNEPYRASGEPANDRQIPFRRLTTYRGYLGQGYRTVLSLPPSGGGTFTQDSKLVLPGVFSEWLGLAGDYGMASARGMMFYHVPPFPVPVPGKRPEDPQGNEAPNSDNDKIAAAPGGDSPQGAASGQAVLDDLAYGMGWSAQHPFHYRGKDWTTPEPSQLPAGKPADQALPIPVEYDIDHRHKAKFIPTVAGYGFRPDGTWVLSGTGGEEIIVGGGQITLRAKKVVVESGGDFIVMAGRDLVLRANRAFEAVSATDSMYIKAERQLELLGGNGGSGGVIIESRATGTTYDFTKVGTEAVFGGLIFKSRGVIANLGNQLYLRSGGGGVTIDAAAGKANIDVNAASMNRYLTSAAVDQFNGKSTNVYTANQAILTGSISTDSDLIVAGQAAFRGPLTVSEGHIATSESDRYDGKTVQLNNQGLVSARALVNSAETKATEANKTATTLKKNTVATLYEANRIGHTEVVSGAGFSFRTTKQAGTEDFKFYESRWAMTARLLGLSNSVWTEPSVRTAGEDTYPFPGKDAWLGESFTTADPTLYDVSSGRMQPPGAIYEEAEYAAPVTKAAQSNYPIS